MLVVVADCKDVDEDVGCNNVAATNTILLSLLTDRLRNIHDIELPLGDHDAAEIVKLLCSRNLDDAHYTMPCISSRFHCYVRILTQSHLVFTVVPAMYEDVITVMSMLDSLGSTDDAARLTEDKNVGTVADMVNGHSNSADEDLNMSENVEENSAGFNDSGCRANDDVDTLMPNVTATNDDNVTKKNLHNIRLPLFVFDCLLNLISDQLVHHSNCDRPPDIVDDFTSLVMQQCKNKLI